MLSSSHASRQYSSPSLRPTSDIPSRISSRVKQKLFSLLALCLSLPISLIAQSTDTAASRETQALRDPAAVTIVETALAKLGGAASITAIHDAGGSGTCNSSVLNAGGEAPSTELFSWIIAGREFRHESGTGNSKTIMASGHGRPARQEAGSGAAPWSYNSAAFVRPYHIPALVLNNELSDPHFGVRTIGLQSLNGSQVQVVAISRYSQRIATQGTLQYWYFDIATGLPLKVEYLLPTENAGELFAKITTLYSGFAPTSGVLMPMSTQTEIASTVRISCTTDNIKVNQGYPSSVFDLLAGGSQ